MFFNDYYFSKLEYNCLEYWEDGGQISRESRGPIHRVKKRTVMFSWQLLSAKYKASKFICMTTHCPSLVIDQTKALSRGFKPMFLSFWEYHMLNRLSMKLDSGFVIFILIIFKLRLGSEMSKSIGFVFHHNIIFLLKLFLKSYRNIMSL